MHFATVNDLSFSDPSLSPSSPWTETETENGSESDAAPEAVFASSYSYFYSCFCSCFYSYFLKATSVLLGRVTEIGTDGPGERVSENENENAHDGDAYRRVLRVRIWETASSRLYILCGHLCEKFAHDS